MSALYFPVELSLADTDCVVCQDDAKNPVFCTTCKKMLCFACIMRCESSAGCPTCRGQIQRNVLRDQCKLYSCENHDQLLTMLCTDCEVCVCKQCLAKDADHAKHSFVSIDSIRADLAQAMDKLYEYMDLVDGFNGLGTVKNISGELAEKYFTFSNVLQANIDKIKSTVAEIEGHNLKNLIKNRKDIKALLQATVDELDQMNEPEPREIYELEIFPMEVNPKPSGNFRYIYTNKIFDNFGNRWKINFFPKYHKFRGASNPNFCAFSLSLKSGIPGRSDNTFDAVFFQIERFSEASEEFTKQNAPTNHVEKFFKDKTGTQWRIGIKLKRSNSIQLRLEHFDGAAGRYEFFAELINPNDESLNVKYTACHQFTFGATYCIRKLSAPFCGAVQSIKVGIRPAPQLTGTKRIRAEVQRMLRKLAGNG
ncbi:hypothetical protein quinque_002850 [Culex quinquefasciatus]